MFKFLHMDRISKGTARTEKFRRGSFPFSFLCIFLMKKYPGYQPYFLFSRPVSRTRAEEVKNRQ